MLKQFFKNTDEKGNITISPGLWVCISIFAVLVLLVIFVADDPVFNKEIEVDSVKIKSLIEGVKDNYTLYVTETKGESKKDITVTTDSKLKLYDGSFFGNNDYIVYNDKTFLMDIDTMTVTKTEDSEILKTPYFDLDFIKKITSNCKYKFESRTVVNCEISFEDYLRDYNEYYGKNIDIVSFEETKNILVSVKYSNTAIYLINIDFTSANNIIDADSNTLNYSIKVSSTCGNNYDDIYNQYKDILES